MSLNSRTHTRTDEILHPAAVSSIVEKYEDILGEYENIPGKDYIYPNVNLRTNQLSALFPLKEHPIHGKTGLRVIEKYDENEHVSKYLYQWKIIIPKLGIKLHHLSAWGNDPHDAERTPEEYVVESEPHHHHHVPFDWSQRKDNWNVWTLEEAFEFVAPYIRSGQAYQP